MTIKELIEKLSTYPPTTEVGFVVEYTDHWNCGSGTEDGRCYCSNESHELNNISLHHQSQFTVTFDGTMVQELTKLWIHGSQE